MAIAAAMERWRKPALVAVVGVLPSILAIRKCRNHDQRVLSEDEVQLSQVALRHLSPTGTTTKHHVANLGRCGATVVNNFLLHGDILLWNQRVHEAFQSFPQQQRGKKKIVKLRGRLHCDIPKRSKHHKDMAALGGEQHYDDDDDDDDESLASSCKMEDSLQALAESYFHQHGITKYRLTQLQFLNAKAGSTHQIWHRDNTAPGLTAIVALCNVEDNGPTELMLNTHHGDAVWSTIYKQLGFAVAQVWSNPDDDDNDDDDDDDDDKGTSKMQQRTKLLLACVKAGDAIIYDSRVLHRGRGYNHAIDTKSACGDDDSSNARMVDRPVLVLRWDAVDTPPPGAGLIMTNVNRYLGSFLVAILFGMEQVKKISSR